ncbi:RimK family protein [Alteromonas flava]|uniref:RimK family protein n=1 Tax=Alteromonas flava TaxID=2048003 RepID=UPI000C287177|nr:RimK family protein [Alteromonas flava]
MAKPLIVADSEIDIGTTDIPVELFADYLAHYPKKGEPKMLVINLCDTSRYLGEGYYCSLLAEARKHQVLPSVSTINDLKLDAHGQARQVALTNAQSKHLKMDESIELLVFFGQSPIENYRKVAKHLFGLFPAPILKVVLSKTQTVALASVQTVSVESLDSEQTALFSAALQRFTESTFVGARSNKTARWDMAILYNPEEKTPPSDSKALANFVKAAQRVGIDAELITPDQVHLIDTYDALFIRETTAINHHTYRIARRAEQHGLVVIDDATSILRCCNKVFLQDAFTYSNVPAPRSEFVSSCSAEVCADLEQRYGYPMVLKLPESAFSLGVHKVESRDELRARLTQMLEHSSIVLVQEFLFTDYDWRIGVLNGKPIYACRYFMARNHWQIYNHESKKDFSGGFETLPTFEVPRPVLDAAVRASAVIGKGLYGVDIKQIQNKVYVIEVNDNPSIESKVEDVYLGKELYTIIMEEFAQRLEARGR